ncbi:MAG: hypothetical protein K6T66_08665 [Peptococcaceae bacterium]|nr:hypothetical protein [Peptococcaceae bacterium]
MKMKKKTPRRELEEQIIKKAANSGELTDELMDQVTGGRDSSCGEVSIEEDPRRNNPGIEKAPTAR